MLLCTPPGPSQTAGSRALFAPSLQSCGESFSLRRALRRLFRASLPPLKPGPGRPGPPALFLGPGWGWGVSAERCAGCSGAAMCAVTWDLAVPRSCCSCWVSPQVGTLPAHCPALCSASLSPALFVTSGGSVQIVNTAEGLPSGGATVSHRHPWAGACGWGAGSSVIHHRFPELE